MCVYVCPYLCYYHTTVVVLEEVNCIRDKPSTHFPTPFHLSLHPIHLSAVVSLHSIYMYVCYCLRLFVCVVVTGCVWVVVLSWTGLMVALVVNMPFQYIYTHFQHTHFLSSWDKTGSGVYPAMASPACDTHNIN